MKTKKPIKLVVSGLISILFVVSIVYAIDTVAEGYQVGSTAKTIDAHGTCRTVKTDSGSDIFVPTKTAAEWTAFRDNAPVGVTFAACSPPLVNGNHTEADCATAGGIIIGSKCRFYKTSCPSGWNQYLNWSSTREHKCAGGGGTCLVGTTCRTSYHSTFSNIAPETCAYEDDAFLVYGCKKKTCTANISYIGCY